MVMVMTMALALGLAACEGSPEPPEFPLGEEPDVQPGGLTDAGGGPPIGGQPGGQPTGLSSTTAAGTTSAGEPPTMTPEEQALAQVMGQIGTATGAAPGSQPGMPSSLPPGAAPTGMTASTGQPSGGAAGSAAGGDCCACTITSRQTIDDPRLPCQFDIPGDWQAGIGTETGMLSAMAGRQNCGTICPSGQPSMSVSYGTGADANAATMQDIWKMGMRKTGTAECGDGEVTFYSSPVDTDEQEKLGGIKFYVNIDGRGYGGTAIFSCGEPGGWMRYRDLFVESFADNPDSSFPE